MDQTNHQFRLANRPSGMPKPSDWSYGEEPVGEPGEGQALVRVRYISLDPAMRGWMNDMRSYVPPVGIGEVMRAFAAGEVIASGAPELAVGESVTGLLGAQEYAIVPAAGVFKADTSIAPLPVHLGVLGMPGVTAYFGLLEIGAPKEGETVLVSGAAGAVGGLVGQIAKIKGARAVGIAGGAEKCRCVVEELGFDAAIDYKSENVAEAIGRHAPDGVNVYFDNVGGEILDAALAHLAREARVVICGAISQYNATGAMRGPSNYMSLLINHASMTGFVVSDYAGRWGEAVEQLGRWLSSGQIVALEDIAEGLENFPDVLLRLFTGENTGKQLLKVGD